MTITLTNDNMKITKCIGGAHMVYLGNAATTAVSAAAHNAMFPFLYGEYGNPYCDADL